MKTGIWLAIAGLALAGLWARPSLAQTGGPGYFRAEEGRTRYYFTQDDAPRRNILLSARPSEDRRWWPRVWYLDQDRARQGNRYVTKEARYYFFSASDSRNILMDQWLRTIYRRADTPSIYFGQDNEARYFTQYSDPWRRQDAR